MDALTTIMDGDKMDDNNEGPPVMKEDTNLLINGSFEDTVVSPGKLVQVSDDKVAGWMSMNGEPIELWGAGYNDVPAEDGTTFLDVDWHHKKSHDKDYIYQDIQTRQGQTYEASFYIRPVKSKEEKAVFMWNGHETTFTAKEGEWLKCSVLVDGTGKLDRFALRESEFMDGDNSVGPLIDNVRLEPLATFSPTVTPATADPPLVTDPLVMQADVRSGNRGGGGGDPHFKTWSGLKYDYHGECDLVLIDHPSFADGRGLRVHIRTTRRQFFSYIERIALQIGDDVLEFANRNVVLYNGNDMGSATKFAGYQVNTFQTAISVRLNDKAKARIDFITRKSGTPYVVVDGGSTTLFEGSLGLVGDWATGQMVGRDGETVFADPEAFGAEWQVRDVEPSLFQTARFPQYPAKCIPPKKMLGNRLGDSHMRAAAEQQCSAWKEDKDDCIFDVMAMRDIHAADDPVSFLSLADDPTVSSM
jgi:von Willebrand factor type D domain